MVRAGVPNMPAWTRVDGRVVYVLAAQVAGGGTQGPGGVPHIPFRDGALALLDTSPSCRCHHDVEDCPHREDAVAPPVDNGPPQAGLRRGTMTWK
jgi:hypothetical protein